MFFPGRIPSLIHEIIAPKIADRRPRSSSPFAITHKDASPSAQCRREAVSEVPGGEEEPITGISTAEVAEAATSPSN